MTDKKLKKALLAKLKITPQALSQRVQKLKKEFPMMQEDATYVIAHEEGIDLNKYLDQQTIQNIQRLISQRPKNNIVTNKNKQHKNSIKNITINISGEFRGTDPLLDEKILNEAKQMATIYPLLYVLENSIRQFVCLAMKKYYGDDWWKTKVPKDLQTKVETERMSSENINKWHQKKGKREIDYLDFLELLKLISKFIDKVTPQIIPGPNIEWIRQLINEVYASRCVLCHMNPLHKDSVDSVKLRFKQWQKQMQANIKLLL